VLSLASVVEWRQATFAAPFFQFSGLGEVNVQVSPASCTFEHRLFEATVTRL